jgi:hypothetical protein
VSYGEQTRNPWEVDESIPDMEAEHFSPCACGTEGCVIDDRDISNIRLGRDWFTYRCALTHSTLMAQCVIDAIQREDKGAI